MRAESDRAPRAAGRPLVLGHRGASAEAPENTIAAFRLALEQGADGVELDVRRCRTGEVVVVHDADTARVAGAPLRIATSSLAELRALDVGALAGARFRGERIPRLEEVLEAVPGAIVNVELKSERGRADLSLAAAAARAIAAARAESRVVVSSFDYRLVVAFRLAAPAVPVGLLFDAEDPGRLWTWLGVRLLRPAAVHPDRRLVTPERVRAWTARGLGVNVWTVDDADEARRLADLGVTALITNAPRKIRAALAERP
jgi:glycerophosphoryl diester phosphodiesterase